MGKVLFALYADAKDAAATRSATARRCSLLRAQLQTQPRTADGGFWHKQIYPHQMWLDGVYMASPFLAQFASVFGEPAALDEAAKQILLAEKHLRDPKTGLLCHGWDEAEGGALGRPDAPGARRSSGGAAMGWYAMAVVDVLGEMPKQPPRPRRGARRSCGASPRRIASVQDRTTGVWWQVLDAGARAGQLPRGLRVRDVRLCAVEGGQERVARRQASSGPSRRSGMPACSTSSSSTARTASRA